MADFLNTGVLAESVNTVVTSASTVVLSDKTIVRLTGTIAQSIVLPIGTSCFNGQRFVIGNKSTATATIRYNDTAILTTLASGSDIEIRLFDNSTSNGTWVLFFSPIGFGSIIPGGIPGSVLFVGSLGNLEQDNANLFWDDSNNRLGVNTTGPTDPVTVAGIIRSTTGGFKFPDNTTQTTAAFPLNTYILTAAATAANNDQIFANSVGGPFDITLPLTPVSGYNVTLIDYSTTWETSNITVKGNGANINGSPADYTLNVSATWVKMLYVDITQGWRTLTFNVPYW
jgi:hypothetical protein